jgi:thiamine-phosphate pyrophosphorylase
MGGMPGDARLYLVCPAIAPARLRAALAGGVDLVQLRMKDAPDDAVLREAAWMREACAAACVPFLVNDRPDLARRAGADGVHVGQDDVPVAEARELVGPGRLVGLSTHEPAHLAAAAAARPDYIAVGPVHATPTKPGRPAAGLDYVRHAAAAAPADLPWFAIGGIDPDTIGAVVEAGARRVVVVRAITKAPDPAAAAAALKAALLEAPVHAAQP